MTIPPVYRRSREGRVATFNSTDFVTGEGIMSFYLSVAADSSTAKYLLLPQTLVTSQTDGLLATGTTYEFRSNDLEDRRKIQGNAFFQGWGIAASSLVVKVTINKEKGELSLDGVGSIDFSSATEETYNNTGAYVLEKTISTSNNFINKAEIDMKITGLNTNDVKITYKYIENTEADVTQTTTSETYVTKTFTNPNRGRKVKEIEIYRRVTGGNANFENVNIYGENTSGLTTTALSSQITSHTLGIAGGVLLKIPLITSKIARGERIMASVVLSGGGSLITDPTGDHETPPTAKLNIPFKPDLT